MHVSHPVVDEHQAWLSSGLSAVMKATSRPTHGALAQDLYRSVPDPPCECGIQICFKTGRISKRFPTVVSSTLSDQSIFLVF